MEPGTKVYNRNGAEFGYTTGAKHACRLDGCCGQRITVRWPDGKITHPCSKGLVWDVELEAWRVG